MDDYETILRRLAIRDDRYLASLLAPNPDQPCPSGLDQRTHALARVGALIALDATPPSYMEAVESARAAGASPAEIVGVLIAVVPDGRRRASGLRRTETRSRARLRRRRGARGARARLSEGPRAPPLELAHAVTRADRARLHDAGVETAEVKSPRRASSSPPRVRGSALMQLARPTRAARLALLVICAGCVLTWCAAASADLADETALAESYAPVVRLVEQPEECGPGEPYDPARRRRALRRPDRRAPRAVEPHRPRQDRPGGRTISSTATSTTSTSPAIALNPGCDYERWARRLTEGSSPTVYAHVAPRAGDPGQAGAAVLVLLPVQRLQQHPRGRLGDDPARLRRAGRARGAAGDDRSKVGYSSHEGAERADVGRRQARDRRRHASGRLPGGRLAREQVHARRSTSAARRRGRRLRRHARAARRAHARREDDPERPKPRRRRRSRGSRSRAAGASCRRRSSTARPGRT